MLYISFIYIVRQHKTIDRPTRGRKRVQLMIKIIDEKSNVLFMQKAVKGGDLDIKVKLNGGKWEMVNATDNSPKAVLVRKMYKEMVKRSSASKEITVADKMANALPYFKEYLMPTEKSVEMPTKTDKVLDTDLKDGMAYDTDGYIMLPKGCTNVVKQMRDFFSEFGITVDNRIVDTVIQNYNIGRNGYKSACRFLSAYLDVINNPCKEIAKEKMNSPEFQAIMKNPLWSIKAREIGNGNSRLKVFYGPAGSGKTTKAMELCDNRVLLCHEQMDSADLFRTIVPNESGHPDFVDSLLTKAMKEGFAVCLDEANHMPLDCLTTLQQVLDSKEVFYNESTRENVYIHPDFQVIITMNLEIDGQFFPLSQPIADRADQIIYFESTPEQIIANRFGTKVRFIDDDEFIEKYGDVIGYHL